MAETEPTVQTPGVSFPDLNTLSKTLLGLMGFCFGGPLVLAWRQQDQPKKAYRIVTDTSFRLFVAGLLILAAYTILRAISMAVIERVTKETLKRTTNPTLLKLALELLRQGTVVSVLPNGEPQPESVKVTSTPHRDGSETITISIKTGP